MQSHFAAFVGIAHGHDNHFSDVRLFGDRMQPGFVFLEIERLNIIFLRSLTCLQHAVPLQNRRLWRGPYVFVVEQFLEHHHASSAIILTNSD